jgi:hypothetical protein
VEFHKGKMELTENGNSKLPFVSLPTETEVCFPWSENKKSQSTIAVSANVPIYDLD